MGAAGGAAGGAGGAGGAPPPGGKGSPMGASGAGGEKSSNEKSGMGGMSKPKGSPMVGPRMSLTWFVDIGENPRMFRLQTSVLYHGSVHERVRRPDDRIRDIHRVLLGTHDERRLKLLERRRRPRQEASV